jgi:hypothetical protein
MPVHPQNSPRGAFVKARIDIGTFSLTANSTAILVPATGFQFASLSSLKITSNSTGIRIGSRYISTNTTGNATT